MSPVHQFLAQTAARELPRMLTQICRDQCAPCFGACDRNWWHYKIRDFPSIILQQAGYALHIAANCQTAASHGPTAARYRQLALASARFWNERATLHGAFEEYYPYEQGYPPAAFSTLAIAKLCHEGIAPLADIRPGLAIAARQLLSRFEAEAANQQIAGTAALCVIRSLEPSLIEETEFQQLLSKTLELQHEEGWFPEYDGPDLGYLAVSIDCLWDIHDHTQDPRILPAIRKAVDYIAWFALGPLGAAGMHNSRNTDYFTPYGLVRLAIEDSSAKASAVIESLFTRNHQGDFHPFDAVDDRYWCHYIGHSVLRALVLIEKVGAPPQSGTTRTSNAPTCKPGSGHALLTSLTAATALVSTRKGAIVTALWPEGAKANDFGWIVQSPEKLFVSHWWSNDWAVSTEEPHKATCQGFLVAHKEHLSAPWKHVALRFASFVAGRRLIKLLKRLVIFKKPQQSHPFTREVLWDGPILVVRDTIDGLSPAASITRAPRTSKRHVASADSFHPEDIRLLQGITRTERIDRKNGSFQCETRYCPDRANQSTSG